jgi:hypothetical protein
VTEALLHFPVPSLASILGIEEDDIDIALPTRIGRSPVKHVPYGVSNEPSADPAVRESKGFDEA